MEKEEILNNFKSITGLDDASSINYLEMFNWSIDEAVSFYFSEGQSENQPSQPTMSNPSDNPYEKSKKQTSSNEGKIMGISDINKKSEDDSDKYYAGGPKGGSGIQIQDPNNKKNVDNLVKNVFQMAKKNVETYEPEEEDKFQGFSGYSLDGKKIEPQVKEGPIKCKITFYRNGFVIDDRSLRSYDDPASQEFLRDISKGLIPRELEVEAQGRHMNIDLIDMKHEDYKEKPKPVNYFEGKGYSLDNEPESKTTNYIVSGQDVEYVLDESKPKTSIQIRLHDGKKVVGKFNLDHTVKHLCSWIEKTQNLPPNTKYELMHSFPPKPITNLDLTIKEAGLSGESIVQKLC